MIKWNSEAVGMDHFAGAATTRSSTHLHQVFQWDLQAIADHTAEKMEWSPSFMADVKTEYRRFLYLALMHPEKNLGMAGPVDELWHDHILHTRDYLFFCGQVAGRYLHHVPSNKADVDRAAYRLTMSLLEDYFGEVNWDVWPNVETATVQCCSSCSHVSDGAELTPA